jgi:hypothetical protein
MARRRCWARRWALKARQIPWSRWSVCSPSRSRSRQALGVFLLGMTASSAANGDSSNSSFYTVAFISAFVAWLAAVATGVPMSNVGINGGVFGFALSVVAAFWSAYGPVTFIAGVIAGIGLLWAVSGVIEARRPVTRPHRSRRARRNRRRRDRGHAHELAAEVAAFALGGGRRVKARRPVGGLPAGRRRCRKRPKLVYRVPLRSQRQRGSRQERGRGLRCSPGEG